MDVGQHKTGCRVRPVSSHPEPSSLQNKHILARSLSHSRPQSRSLSLSVTLSLSPCHSLSVTLSVSLSPSLSLFLSLCMLAPFPNVRPLAVWASKDACVAREEGSMTAQSLTDVYVCVCRTLGRSLSGVLCPEQQTSV